MYKYDTKSWFKLIFEFHKSAHSKNLWWVILLLCLYSFVIVFSELNFKEYFDFQTNVKIHSLLGFVIGLLLVFRTNTAYDRWWEGRKQWGKLINISRSFVLKSNSLIKGQQASDKSIIVKYVASFAKSLAVHLNDDLKYNDVLVGDSAVEGSESKSHVPNYIINRLYFFINKKVEDKSLTQEQFITLDYELRGFIDVLGACERIKNTPIPYSYNLFIKKFIFAYVISMPFALIDDFGYWTVPITGFVLYVLASLEMLAEEIEDPFGSDVNDLPTLEFSSKIEANIKEILEV